ncbi:MAG: ABC transporter ATP-binding protein [Spirochaetales bacterium]|uniref:ABC transporter ATP-binding protein n=1 Tax=Candidatus Thalassospirochaeta sargassi TaxID=3119039 RepID=A0AAJ1IDY4_9SPIO|nr:ABC transporter ATP-binding protein [Spirochaetales bacterium]
MSDNRKNSSTSSRPGPGGRGPGGHSHMNLDKADNFSTAMRRLFKYFGRDKAFLIAGFIAILASVILNTIAPGILGAAITNHLEHELNLDAFVGQMGILLFIYIGAFATNVVSTIAVNFMSNRVIFRMRKEGFDHIQRLSVSYFDKKGIGDIISRMTNDIDMVYQFMSNGFINTINAFFTLIGIIIAMFILNVPLTIAVLATLPVVGILIVIIGRQVRTAAKRKQNEVGNLSAAIEESVTGMKVIQSFHREKSEQEKFNAVNEAARDSSIDMETKSYMMMPIMQLVNVFGLVFVIGVGGLLVVSNPSVYSIGLLTSFIVYARRFFEPLRQAAQVYNMFNSAMAGAERIFEVFDSREELPAPDKPVEMHRIQGRVDFDNVSFGYEESKPILTGIDFTADPGQVTAIVGPTGAGKTTIINLLARFYDVNTGSIKIDGTDLRDYSRADIRKLMGIVLQEPFFFAATIRENLMYGRPDATEEEMIEAAKLSNAHHFISCLPEGYNTKLTERGMNISQGERQLLAIARTVLSDPKILVLDEATSSIDSLTEVKIQQGLLRLMEGRTSFVIAHRLSTIKNADRILVIHNHRIIEDGTHSQLMDAGGFYHKLYSIQFQKAEVTEEMEL